jgi:hypothetical protein
MADCPCACSVHYYTIRWANLPSKNASIDIKILFFYFKLSHFKNGTILERKMMQTYE